MTTTQTVFKDWKQAGEAGFYTRTAWRQHFRKGIKPGAEPIQASVDISENQKPVNFFTEDQTTRMSKRVWNRNYLLDLFVGHPDRCKITTVEQQIFELKRQNLWWGSSVRGTIERGFNYNASQVGIKTGAGTAEGFHVYGQSKTRFCVIDLDLHHPSKESIEAHLDLLAGIGQALPQFISRIKAKTAFYQYRQQPTGIQIWIVTKNRWDTDALHHQTRNFLLSLGGDLDQRLIQAGLPTLGTIEILPTPTHTVSMAGFYGKEIFTSRILTPKNGRCDVISLAGHIYNNQAPGSVLGRYKSLLHATMLVDPENRPQKKVEPPPRPRGNPNRIQQGYVNDLFKKASQGVTAPDCLFHEYLAPLAQFLYFRDLKHSPNRSLKTKRILFEWIENKHHGHVDRINRNNSFLVKSQINRVVDQLESKTGSTLKSWFEQIELMDVRYPHRYRSLIQEMGVSTNENEVTLLTNCKWKQKPSKAQSGDHLRKTRKGLPQVIKQRLAETTFKTAKTRNRLKLFAARLLPMLYPDEQSLSEKKINSLLDLRTRQGARKYKKELARLRLIKGDWERGIVRGKRCSVYALTDWATSVFRDKHGQESEN